MHRNYSPRKCCNLHHWVTLCFTSRQTICLIHGESTHSLQNQGERKTKEMHPHSALGMGQLEKSYLRNRSALPSGRWTWPWAWCPACRGFRWSCSVAIRLHSASRTAMGCPWWGFFGHPTSWTIPPGTQFWRIVDIPLDTRCSTIVLGKLR